MLKKRIRHTVYILAAILWIAALVGVWPLTNIFIVSRYALLAAVFLYLTLLASPFTQFFSGFKYRAHYLAARKALGLSSFVFATTHAYFAVVQVFGGLQMLLGMGFPWIWPFLPGIVSLVILTLMASTSPYFMVNKLGKNWKRLHRFIYAAGVLVVIHAALAAEHYDATILIRVFSFFAVSFLLTLQFIRLNKHLKNEVQKPVNITFWPYLSILTITGLFMLMF